MRNLLFALTFTLAAALPARGAAPGCPTSDAWHTNVHAQVEHLLASSAPGVRAEALQLVLALHRRGCLQDAAGAFTAPLLQVYRHDPVEGHRIMAAVVLDELGDTYGLDRMRVLSRGKERHCRSPSKGDLNNKKPRISAY